MTEETRFPQAFEAVADVAAQANRIKDQYPNEGTLKSVVTEHETDRAEVRVTVKDAQVASLRLDHIWLEEATVEEVENKVRACVNAAWTKWNEESLKQLRNATPEIAEVSAALERARGTIRQAFDNELDRLTREY
ncbi:hypothetical protein [Aestuariimicrobium ganziense]|uniref:hypothetical protein n=1 Tax=Aestuariimicrobium ganziense TaxID=2773677 RepID=UPI0019450424|nr:hypothetical protein [Aestuariimicrobium ganziense]